MTFRAARSKNWLRLAIIGCVLIAVFVYWRKLPASGAPPKPQLAPKWTLTVSGHVVAPTALSDDGTLYAATEDGWLYAIGAGGRMLWKHEIGPTVAAPVLGDDGTVYVTNKRQQVYAISPDGTEKWLAGGGPYANKNSVWRAGALDGVFFYTSWRGAARAFSVTSGNVKWNGDDGVASGGTASISPSGTVLYPGNGRIDAVDYLGKNVWRYPAMGTPYVEAVMHNQGRAPDGGFWLDSPMAVNSDGTIYAAAGHERLAALNANGTLKWEFIARGSGRCVESPVIAADGTVYFGCEDGTLFALNPDGTKKWTVQTGSNFTAGPLLADDGTIFLANQSGILLVSSQGRLLSRVSHGPLAVSSMTLGPDGTLYIGYQTGTIEAYSMSHGGLMRSAWPKFQHDSRNTGRAAAQ